LFLKTSTAAEITAISIGGLN